MRALDAVGHGSLLAGRYRLEERFRTGADGSSWRALDEALDREVTVRVVRPGHRHTADVIDAARRAGLVEDTRLVRVLDVGMVDGTGFIVSEHLVGRTLEELLQDGPLPAETVRHLVGEAATGLDRASARGLHHLKLSPASLLITSDGAVKVLGTAVEAALTGEEQDEDPLGADRVDAVGLVSMLYAGLTGRWPGVVDGPLGPAPQSTGHPVPPGELTAGVPADLDLICRSTLGPTNDGPRSPGQLIERLSPWSSSASAGLGNVDDGAHRLPEEAAPAREAVSLGAVSLGARSGAATSTAGEQSEPVASWRGWDDLIPPDRSAPPAPRAATAAPAGPPSSGPPNSGAPNSGRPGGAASGTASAAGSRGPAARAGDADSWSLFEPVVKEEPLGPFLPPAPLTRPPRNQTQLVLVVVAGLVVLGLILAVFTLRGLGSATPLVNDRSGGQTGPTNTPVATSPSTPATESSGAASGAASGSPGRSSTGSPTVSGPPAEITGIQALDPQGDGDENGSSAPLAIDDDKSTTWRSARYQSSSFGGLKKGLGLYLTLGEGTVHSVVIDMPGSTGGTVELRTAPGPGLDSSVVVSTATGQGGKMVITPTQPLAVPQLLLWFTDLPRQSNGEFRLVVSEITVT